jgi:hypothetical protein
MNKQVEAMKALGLSEEEIADILKADKEIDRGAKLFELDPELEAGAKKARRAERKPTEVKRERAPNNDKRFLLNLLHHAITAHDDPGFGEVAQSEILNPEREFIFIYNGTKYKVVLSCPRS